MITFWQAYHKRVEPGHLWKNYLYSRLYLDNDFIIFSEKYKKIHMIFSKNRKSEYVNNFRDATFFLYMYFDDGVMATVLESTGCNSSVKWPMYSQISIKTNLFIIDRISAMILLTFINRYSQEITDNFYVIFLYFSYQWCT